MICFDCAQAGREAPAVGMCAGCAAGLCLDHAQVYPVALSCAAPPVARMSVDPPARVLRCRVCAAAHAAQQACESDGVRACMS